jgi:hypothetical protein
MENILMYFALAGVIAGGYLWGRAKKASDGRRRTEAGRPWST